MKLQSAIILAILFGCLVYLACEFANERQQNRRLDRIEARQWKVE